MTASNPIARHAYAWVSLVALAACLAPLIAQAQPAPARPACVSTGEGA
jgi:hypothetical protein